MIDADRRALIAVARAAVDARVHRRPLPAVTAEGALAEHAGAFVTLRRHGRLRGCIGNIEPVLPLATVVSRCAASAASEDPRFPPVAVDECADLEVDVSVLGPAEPISGPNEIDVGKHGLIVEQGRHRGLLLPQVAVEHGWDAETFVSQACIKAGLRPTAWQTGAQVFRFEAEVVVEQDL